MNRAFIIAWYEFRELVWRKRFLFSLLSLPALLFFSVALGIFTEKLLNATRPVGYVDQAQLLRPDLTVPLEEDEDPITLIAYPDEASARADLEAGKLQAYYVISADYPQTRAVRLVYLKRPGSSAQSQFRRFLQVNLLAEYPPQVRERLLLKTTVDVRVLSKQQEFPNGEPNLGLFLPLIITFLFMMLVLTNVNYLIAAVTKEKENRLAEIMLITVRPAQLISGKILAITGMTLVQGLVWGGMGGLSWLLFTHNVQTPALTRLTVDWGFLGGLFLLLIASYAFFAIAMVFIGIIMPDVEQGQKLGGLASLIWALPLWLLMPIVENPTGPLALLFSFIPGAAPTSLALRALMGPVPFSQLGLSLSFTIALTALMLFITARTFRLGSLMYGKRLSWREIWPTLRAKE